MNTNLSSNRLFAIGFIILLVTNGLILFSVASNRSGPVEAQVVLTERELKLPFQIHKENSGLVLRISFRVPVKDDKDTYGYGRSPAWLDEQKLKTLGFNLKKKVDSPPDTGEDKPPLPKEVFIVLEMGGTPYEQALKKAQQVLKNQETRYELSKADTQIKKQVDAAKKRLDRERFVNSRLFAVDAGLNSKPLRVKYPDRSRYIIVKAIVTHGSHERGRIKMLSVDQIYVPLKYRRILDDVLDRKALKTRDENPSPYQVELAWGRRLEPWVVSVKHREEPSNQKTE